MLKKIQEQYAKENGYSAWSQIPYDAKSESRNQEVARRYALAVTTNALREAARLLDSDDFLSVNKFLAAQKAIKTFTPEI